MTKKYITAARETLAKYGAGEGIDLQHLLAVLIGPKATPEFCGKLAAFGVRRLSDMTTFELREEGLSENEAQRLFAGFEMARKWNHSTKGRTSVIRSPEDAYELLKWKIGQEKQEIFYVLYLNTKNEVIYEQAVFKGSLNAAVVHPREVFRPAFQYAVASIVCGHNHPSGCSQPSREDISVTQRLVECGKIFGIDCVDHIIVGDGRYVSLKEKGYL